MFVIRAHDLLGLGVGSMWPRALEKLMEMEATANEWWPSAGELSNDSLFVSGPRVDSQERALLVSLAKPVFAPRRAEAAAPYPRLIGVLGLDVSFIDLFDDLLYPNATTLLHADNAFVLNTQGAIIDLRGDQGICCLHSILSVLRITIRYSIIGTLLLLLLCYASCSV